MKANISFDIILDDDMPFVEGCYRIDNGEWQVFSIRHSLQGAEEIGVKKNATWESGVRGISIVLHDNEKINKSTIFKILSDELNIVEWIEVNGPDSIIIR